MRTRELAGKTEGFGRTSRGKLGCENAGSCGENWRFWENSAGKMEEAIYGGFFRGHVGDIITCVNSTFLLA